MSPCLAGAAATLGRTILLRGDCHLVFAFGHAIPSWLGSAAALCGMPLFRSMCGRCGRSASFDPSYFWSPRRRLSGTIWNRGMFVVCFSA